MTNSAKEKTAFACREGLFQFDTMSFGLCNATATFQQLMDMNLSKLKWKHAVVYVDDINVYSTLTYLIVSGSLITLDKHV